MVKEDICWKIREDYPKSKSTINPKNTAIKSTMNSTRYLDNDVFGFIRLVLK